MVALEEDRRAPALADRGRQDHRGVLRRTLVGVGHLALRDLEHDRRRVALEGRVERLPGGEVGRGTDIDGRHGEGRGRNLAAPARHVQLVDRRRSAAERLARGPDHPACRVSGPLVLGEDGVPGERVDLLASKSLRVGDVERGAADLRDRLQAAEDRIGRDVVHRVTPSGAELNATEAARRG